MVDTYMHACTRSYMHAPSTYIHSYIRMPGLRSSFWRGRMPQHRIQCQIPSRGPTAERALICGNVRGSGCRPPNEQMYAQVHTAFVQQVHLYVCTSARAKNAVCIYECAHVRTQVRRAVGRVPQQRICRILFLLRRAAALSESIHTSHCGSSQAVLERVAGL